MYKMDAISSLIKVYLTKKGISQSHLAKMCNTTRSNMSQKLSQNDMEIGWAIRISEALGHNFLYDMAVQINVPFKVKLPPAQSLELVPEPCFICHFPLLSPL